MIPAGGYLVIWCDSKDKVINLGGGNYELHTNFNLSSAGETVTLYNTDFTTVEDTVDVPALPRDYSYGRDRDG